MYEQHESCTFTDILLGFPEYICTRSKIMDQELRLDWSQFTRKLTLPQDYTKKAFEHALYLRKCEWWIISKTRCNGHAWEMEKKLACRTEEWTAHSYYSGSFRCSWVRSRLKPTFEIRVVTKISSCQVNTTSRRGIKWLGVSFGSIFLLFADKSSWGLLS